MQPARATFAQHRPSVGVVCPLTTDLRAWRDRARRVADSGYSTLLMPDVPESGRRVAVVEHDPKNRGAYGRLTKYGLPRDVILDWPEDR